MRVKFQVCVKATQSLTIYDLGHLAQLVRASRSHREGHWFKSSNVHHVNKSLFREGWAFCFF